MPSYTVSVAAASAGVGTDLFSGEVFARAPQDRAITGIGIKGSAAEGDTETELYVDEVRVGNYFNTGTGFPNKDDMVPLEGNFVPGGAQLRCIIRDAPATNPINVRIDVEDI